MKKQIVIESMTRIEMTKYTIRIWRQEKELKEEYDNHQLLDTAAALLKDRLPIHEICEELASLDRVNAVEVLHKGNNQGNGIVYYPTWP